MIGPRDVVVGMVRRLQALRRAAVAEVEDINRLIYHVLQGGVVLSLAFVVLAFLLHASGEGPLPRSSVAPRDLFGSLLPPSPAGLMNLGVLILLLTPVGRVALSLVAYAEERDLRYVAITAIVLANLTLALALGLA